MAKQEAIQDRNKVPALIAHSGTADTADTIRLTASADGYLNVNSNASLTVGTIERINTIGTLELGTTTASLALNSGTITTIAAGTQNTLGTVGVLNNGTLAQVTSVSNLVSGTLLNSGTTTGVGVVTSVANLVSGTLAALAAGTITTGTVAVTTGTVVGNVASGATDSGNPVKVGGINNTTKPTLTDGQRGDIQLDTRGNIQMTLFNANTNTSIVANADNADAVAVSSSNNKLIGLSRNTVFNGATWDRMYGDTGGVWTKINPTPASITPLTHGTLGTAGGSFFGTISAASGAGTKHYVTGVDIVMQSGTADVRILAGTAIQGTGVLAAGQFPAGGGIAKTFQVPFATGTNSELTYHFVGAGTAFITVSYWKGA